MTSDELFSVLRASRPSWEQDGMGVRGGPVGGPFAPAEGRPELPAFAVGAEFGVSGKLSADPFTDDEFGGGGGIFPRGCPFDLIPTVEAPLPTEQNPNPPSTKSSIAVAQHESCQDGVGNLQFEKYGSLFAEQQKIGLFAYFGKDSDGFFELATKGQEETYLWGYADQGESNFRGRAFGAEADLVVWSKDGADYAEMRRFPGKVTVYGFSDNQVYNFLLGADSAADSSYLKIYGTGSNVYTTVATEVDKSFLWGYAENGGFNHRMESTSAKSGASFWDSSSDGYLEAATKGQAETYLWGYSDQGQLNFRARVLGGSDGAIELWNNADGGRAALRTNTSNAFFEASMDNDFSYLTQNTLRIEYANGDSATMNPGQLWLNYDSGSWLQAYGGGLYMNDGANFVQINPPSGKDAYFQQVDVCVNGENKKAYVLMSDPE